FGVPDVTAPTPLSTLPLPLENTAVSVVDVPAVMVLCAAVNEVMLGGGTTLTVALANAIVPAALVTVSVYVVVEAGDTVTGVPEVTAPMPLLTLPLPLENTGLSVVELPAVIVVAAAANWLMTGARTTVTVTV